LEKKLYSATGADYEKYLAILKDHNSDYRNQILCTDIYGMPTEYSFLDFKSLTMMVGEYRAVINSQVSQLLSDVQDAESVEQLKQLDETIRKTNHHKILSMVEQRIYNDSVDDGITP
jgi:flagellar biosynthesis regulator FlbT